MITVQEKMLISNMSKEDLNNEFITYCIYGDIKSIDYFLNNNEISNKIDINYNNGLPLREACTHGHLDLVKKFLNKDKPADIHIADEQSLKNACFSGHLNIVKYLLTSQEIDEHADIYASNSRAFLRACQEERIEIIDYLIFEYNIILNEDIENMLSRYPEIAKKFEVRNLYQKIDQGIVNKNKYTNLYKV